MDGIGEVAGSTAAIGGEGTGAAVADPTPAAGGEGGAEGGDGTGAGDGTGSGDGDGAAGGDGAATDDGEGEGATAGESDDAEAAGSEEDDPLGQGDGRTIDDKTKKAFSALKKVDPASEKILRENYHKAQHIQQELGAENLSDALGKVRQMAATIDGLGGQEGIDEMRQEVADYREEITQFREGKPELFETLYKADGTGEQLANSLGSAMDFMATKDMKRFDEILIPRMVSRLNQINFIPSMPTLLSHIQKGDGEAAYALAKEMKQVLDNASKFAADRKNVKAPDPEREALNREKAEIATTKAQIRDNEIATVVNRSNNEITAKTVSTFVKDIGLKPEGRRNFVNLLNSRVYERMGKDSNFQTSANNLKNKGEIQKAARFISAKFAEFLPDEFRALRDEMYPNYSRNGSPKPAAAAAAKPATNGKPAAAAAKVAYKPESKPDREAVDWNKTSNTLWIAGSAYLKDGRLVKWDWKKV